MMVERLVTLLSCFLFLFIMSSCDGKRAPQPRVKPAPPIEALHSYLDLDHEDFLQGAGETKARSQALRKVMEFKTDLEPEFIRLLDKGPNDQVLRERERFLEEQWGRREAFLKKKPNLGLKKDDLDLLLSITKEDYITRGREQLIQRYQEKATAALLAINTPSATGAVRNFRKKTNNKVLKQIIDRKLPPEEPGGLKVVDPVVSKRLRKFLDLIVKESRPDREGKPSVRKVLTLSNNESPTPHRWDDGSPNTLRGWPPNKASKQLDPQVRRLPTPIRLTIHR